MTTTKDPRGRKPLASASGTVRISVCVTAGQRLQLRRVASARGVRLSEVLREAIDEQIDPDDREPYDDDDR
jgi:hypothetical protein